MSALLAPQAVDLSSSNTTLVIVVGVIAILAVAIAMVFRGQVLAANDGTENMKTIAAAVQEGASAYLNRQFRTLSIFAVVVAIDLLDTGNAGVGVLNAAVGAGGVLGSIFAFGLVQRGRLASWFGFRP